MDTHASLTAQTRGGHADWRRAARWLLLAATAGGVLLLGCKARGLLATAVATLGQISWLAVLALPVFALWTVAAAQGWRVLMVDAGVSRIPSLARLCLIRVEAQAVNLVLPLAGVGGEALRAAVLGRQTRQGTASTASVASDVVTEVFACFVFASFGVIAGWHAIPLAFGWRVVLLALPAAGAVALYALPPLLARLGCRVGSGRVARWLASVCTSMASTRTVGWWRSAAWHIVEKTLIAGETWIYAHAMGFPLSIHGALLATAMMTLASSAMFFIPGQVGAADGGVALGLQWLGAGWSVGFAVALARRVRQLLVTAVGLSIIGGSLVWRRAVRGELQPSTGDAVNPVAPTQEV